MPKKGHEELIKLAEEQRRPIADVVRVALEMYLFQNGKVVDLSVKRGGKRK